MSHFSYAAFENKEAPIETKEQTSEVKLEKEATEAAADEVKSHPLSAMSKTKVEDLPEIETPLPDVVPDTRNIRRIIAEDPEYNLATVTELEQKSLNRIIENFACKIILNYQSLSLMIIP